MPAITLKPITHADIDARSLALHQAVAQKLKANPGLIEVAKVNLSRWLKTCSPRTAPVLRQWEEILSNSDITGIISIIESPSEASTQLRQSSPFCGILSNEERTAILLSTR